MIQVHTALQYYICRFTRCIFSNRKMDHMMGMKRILILALFGDPTLPAGVLHTGGFNQTLREFLISLVPSHLPISVITDTSCYCNDDFTRVSDYIEIRRVSVTQIEHEDQETLRMGQNRILEDILHIVGDGIADVALIHSFYWFSGHLARLIHERYQIPYIHTPISMSYNKTAVGREANCPFQIECEQAFLQTADLVLAITEQEANILVSQYRIKRASIIVTGRSVDGVFHTPARNINGCPRGVQQSYAPADKEIDTRWWSAGAYTFLGRMVAIKGPLQIIQAWVLLRDRYGAATPPLWLIGGTPTQIANLREQILKRVKCLPEYEAQQEIVWWGYLDQVSISALFLKTLVLVTHSQFEAGGRVVLEAMCQGKPVIATPNGFAADYIQNHVNGFIAEYGDTKRLSRCMEYFIRQPYLTYTMGNAAKQTFEQIERRWNYTGIHREIYQSYLTGSKKPVGNQKIFRPQIAPELLEKVDCFPYCDICFSKEEWMKELSAVFSSQIEEFHSVIPSKPHARHFEFNCKKEQYRVKQFYNRLNKDVIWDPRETRNIFIGADQLQISALSQYFAGVVPITAMSGHGNYYVLPELFPANPDYSSLYALLKDFSLSEGSENLRSIAKRYRGNCSHAETLESIFNSLTRSSKELGEGISRQMLRYFPDMEDLIRASGSSARYGLNYGKTLKHHVFLHDTHLLLLPTANWYWGELGPDFISAALWSGERIGGILDQGSDTRQLLWLASMAWKNVLRAEWNGAVAESRWKRLLSLALSELGIRNKIAIS